MAFLLRALCMVQTVSLHKLSVAMPTSVDKALPVYGKSENVRDWLFVEDHIRAIDLIFHKGKIAETYNILVSNDTTLRKELVRKGSQQLKKFDNYDQRVTKLIELCESIARN